MQLNRETKAYLDMLAADIAKGATKENILDLATKAHECRQAFISEMAGARTERAKMATKALCSDVWLSVQRREVAARVMYECDLIQGGK